MATIKEVAKLAGVSISTVSRALSKKVFVEEATREKVLKAVKQLSYKPNFMAKGLKEGRSKTLALVLPDIVNPFFPTMVKYVERHAAEKGYSIILYDCGQDPRQEKRSMEALKSHYVDGVIFTSTTDDLSSARALQDHGIPVVVLNREADIGVQCITGDNREGARTIINHLVRHGHRKIACLQGPADQLRYRQRLEGCLEAFRENGIDDYSRFMVKEVNSIEEAYTRTKKLLAKADRPTAIFAFFDMLALGVYSGVHDAGLTIPGDVSVAGFDDIYMSEHLIPGLTTYAQPTEKVTKMAIASLFRQIEEGAKPSQEITEVKGGLVVRKSVAKCL